MSFFTSPFGPTPEEYKQQVDRNFAQKEADLRDVYRAFDEMPAAHLEALVMLLWWFRTSTEPATLVNFYLGRIQAIREIKHGIDPITGRHISEQFDLGPSAKEGT